MRIIAAMSGGVDSSVAAALLQQAGHEVIGVTLQLWGKDVCSTAGTRLCCSVRDTLDAKAVCKRLGIRHEILEREQAFRSHVIDYFVDSYAVGETPNPCIACNDHIKFGSLMEHAQALGAEAVATGHYARTGYDERLDRYTLRCSADPAKDQSYVLFNLTQQQLARSRFPLGELSKPEVREIARSLGFASADKPDSQDICFVRDRDKDGFLRRALSVSDQPGPIVDRAGRQLGTHRGLLGYTIGQREGLGIAAARPLYVIEMDRAANRIVVGERDDLLGREIRIGRVNWVSVAPPAGPVRAAVKIRSRHEPAPATLTPTTDGAVLAHPDEPVSAITPGQAAVFYDGDLVIGGGWIERSSAPDGTTPVSDRAAAPKSIAPEDVARGGAMPLDRAST